MVGKRSLITMTQATKTLSIIFGISVFAVFIRFTFQGTGNSEALSGTVISFEKANVNKIEIKNPERGDFTLQKAKSGWTVQKLGENTNFAADESAITSALEQIQNLKPKSILTRNEADFSRYQVDTTGTEVRLFDGSKELSALIVGRFQFVSQQEFNTYVRNAKSNDVVSVNGFIGSYFSKNLDGWRDKKVWSFDKKGITQLDFVFPGDSSFTIKKVGENKWMSAFDSLSISTVETSINQVADLKAVGFAHNNQTVDTFGTPLFKIVVHLDNGAKQELALKTNPENEGELIAKASGFDFVFTLNKSTLQSSLFRPKKAYLK